MIRRPPRSTPLYSSAASDVYKRQPFFSGFYSKDSIIEAVELSHLPGAGFAYFAVVAGVFVTAFYTFRVYFLVFHGKERFGKSHHDHNGDHADEEAVSYTHLRAHETD